MNDKKPAPKRGNKKPQTNSNSAADLRPGLAARL
ncbi:fmu domain-containing protein, partial [Brucella abortus]